MNNEIAVNELEINGVTYVRKDLVNTECKAESVDGMEYCIVRTLSAGVFAGYVKSEVGQEVTVLQARRLWQWYGASLSELAMDGTPDINKCKCPQEVNEVRLKNVIEIIPATEKAKKSIDSIKIWKA